eukprot:CAMPEP_0183586894 /NCGR_PEP_ID=MMETSP0371-20130417/157958_1 /TAXON_ID=268820 /ORGANISM="Peridinium aciculiferum, Strain PAER-2" /LENGTH=48 /DNA_ID= /DNA_START= /DNA_END= /DNA_ORIENTATION=
MATGSSAASARNLSPSADGSTHAGTGTSVSSRAAMSGNCASSARKSTT